MLEDFTVRPGALLSSGAVCALLLGIASVASGQDRSASGDAERGQTLYTGTYKCYACHGFDAQTGQPRLKPMNFTEQGFITFVQNSPLPQMPAYPDVPDRDLADVYSYILSIPIDAPEVDDLALLSDIASRQEAAFDE